MAIFDIHSNDIKNLDEVGLPTLVYQIMYYEITKLNLLNQGLDISLNTKTADGGSDGEFNNFNKPIPVNHPFLPNSNIVFQFKAAEIGDKSWFEKEILTSDKSDLKPKLKELIQAGYTYLLITNKTDLPAVKLAAKEKVLQELFSSVGYGDTSVKILGLVKLAEWASSIPQIYLNRNPHTKYFELFDFYERDIKRFSDDIEYVNDEKRGDSISQIREEIDRALTSQTSSFIRIEGFSGIGKTRFIYETLNDDKYKNFVLYVQSYKDSILDDLKMFCKKLPTNSQELVIFVIDECPYEEHVQICRHLQDYPNIVVITIDQVLSKRDTSKCQDEKRIILEGLEQVDTVKLIQEINPLLKDDLAKKIAYYTEGYPRLAKFMAESFDIQKGDTNNPDFKSSLLDSIIEKVATNADEIKILQAISMFKMFPNNEEFKIYKSIIFEHFGIDNASASIIIKNFIGKGIVRETGRFLYISPRPVSIHLFNQFIEINDYDFIDELFQKLNNQGLMNSFFEKLQGVAFDTSQHKDLLFQILSKLTYEQISEGFGSKIFYTLCLKDRKYALSTLKNLLKDKTKEDLLKLEDGRRYLVHSLEYLIASKDTFSDSAKILFQLARAENESWGNNATGIFKETFQWILGGTEVNIVKRLDLLKGLYQEFTLEDERLILLEALRTSYPQDRYMATHKDHANFPEHIPEHYHPETQDEIDNYFEKLKELIVFMYGNSSIKLRSRILNDLVHSTRMMMQYEQINIWILDFIEKTFMEHPHLKTLVFEQISMIIEYDKDEKLSQAIINRLEDLYSQFTNAERIEDVKELFFKTEQYRYNSEEIFESHCKAIAQNVLETKNFDGLLESSTSNVSDIGRELALIDKDNTLYEDVLNLVSKLDKESNIRFITAYIFNSTISKTSNHKSLFDEIYNRLNDKSLMFEFIHSTGEKSEIVIEYLYKLLEKKEIDSFLLENLTFGFWLRDFSENEFVKFIDKINSIIDNKCDSFDLCMQYIHKKNIKGLVEKYTLYYIQNGVFACTAKRRVSYYLAEMIDKFFSYNLNLTEKSLLKIWKAILIEFENDGRFEDREFHIIYKVIKKYPDFFWEKIKDKLDELKPKTYPLYSRFVDFMQGGYMSRWFNHSIFSYIESDDVISWLKSTNYEEAKYIVADSLNIDFESDALPDIVIKLLTEFPDDEDLYNSIKVSSEGWSGSYVPVANKKISNINSMLEVYKDNESVIEFLRWVKKDYEYRRDREQIRDAERSI
jgi:hypothetical protein